MIRCGPGKVELVDVVIPIQVVQIGGPVINGFRIGITVLAPFGITDKGR